MQIQSKIPIIRPKKENVEEDAGHIKDQFNLEENLKTYAPILEAGCHPGSIIIKRGQIPKVKDGIIRADQGIEARRLKSTFGQVIRISNEPDDPDNPKSILIHPKMFLGQVVVFFSTVPVVLGDKDLPLQMVSCANVLLWTKLGQDIVDFVYALDPAYIS